MTNRVIIQGGSSPVLFDPPAPAATEFCSAKGVAWPEIVPNADYPVAFVKDLDGNWIIRTRSTEGGTGLFYDETRLRTVAYKSLTRCYATVGRTIVSGGKMFKSNVQPGDIGLTGNGDFALRMGKLADEYDRRGDGPHAANPNNKTFLFGMGHNGNLVYRDLPNPNAQMAAGSSINVNGFGPNLMLDANAPAGTRGFCSAMEFFTNFEMILYDGTVAATLQLSQSFSASGYCRDNYLKTLAPGIGWQDSYGPIYCANADANRAKPVGLPPIVIGRDGTGSIAYSTPHDIDEVQFYSASDPTIMDRQINPMSQPLTRLDGSMPAYAGNTCGRFVGLDNPDNFKWYDYLVSSSEAPPGAWLPMTGTYRWVSRLCGRVSAGGPQ